MNKLCGITVQDSLIEQAMWDYSTQLWTAYINLIYFVLVKAKSKLVMLKLKTHKMKREGKNGEHRTTKEREQRKRGQKKERKRTKKERTEERKKENKEREDRRKKEREPVSYTHLTLPTMAVV